MSRLRSTVPHITSGEELLCMLIFLGQNTEDISAILCICPKSVKQSRYRLRQKLCLPPNMSLEQFIQKLFSDNLSQ